MRKKGFTLIELLSVIVVLAIISLIVTPMITGIIGKVRMSAAKDSAYGVLESANMYYIKKFPPISDQIEFECKNGKCINKNGEALSIKGTIPTSGKVILNKKRISSADRLVIDGYCFKGQKEDLKVSKNCEDLDTTAPIVTLGRVITRKNSLVVTYEIEEKESSIKSVICKYGEDKNNLDKEVEGTQTNCEIKNLEENKKYYYEVIATNHTNLEGKEKGEAKTGETKIEISLTNGTTYTKSKVATVTYSVNNITTPNYYVKTSVATTSNIEGYICNGTVDPETCENTTTTEYEAGKWYKVNGNPNITFNENGIIYALIHDGDEYFRRSLNVDYIDNEPPTNPTGGSIGEVSGSNKTGSIKTAASGSTDNSGSVTYKYIVTNTNSAPANTDSRFTTSRDFTRSCGTSYYAWAIAEDALGNRSGVVSLGSTSDGANSYSDWSGCNKSCGGGTQARTNTCALVTTGLSQSCNTQACCSSTKIGSYGSWSGWSGCSASCGGGTQTRTRTRYYVSNYDGSSCGSDTETGSQACNTQACCSSTTYVDSNGTWGSCSASCGGGTQYYTVTRTYYSAYNGSYCSQTTGLVTSSQACNTQSCGIDTCPGCVYAFPIPTSTSKTKLPSLPYTTNYLNLNSDKFVGFVIDDKGKASRLFSCTLTPRPLCVEFGDSHIKTNRQYLESIGMYCRTTELGYGGSTIECDYYDKKIKLKTSDDYGNGYVNAGCVVLSSSVSKCV